MENMVCFGSRAKKTHPKTQGQDSALDCRHLHIGMDTSARFLSSYFNQKSSRYLYGRFSINIQQYLKHSCQSSLTSSSPPRSCKAVLYVDILDILWHLKVAQDTCIQETELKSQLTGLAASAEPNLQAPLTLLTKSPLSIMKFQSTQGRQHLHIYTSAFEMLCVHLDQQMEDRARHEMLMFRHLYQASSNMLISACRCINVRVKSYLR